MRQQDKLRNRLRDLYENQQYKAPEEEWERASAMLQKERTRRSLKTAAGVLAIAAFVFCVLLAVIPQDQKLNSEKTVASVKEKDKEKSSLTIENRSEKFQNKKEVQIKSSAQNELTTEKGVNQLKELSAQSVPSLKQAKDREEPTIKTADQLQQDSAADKQVNLISEEMPIFGAAAITESVTAVKKPEENRAEEKNAIVLAENVPEKNEVAIQTNAAQNDKEKNETITGSSESPSLITVVQPLTTFDESDKVAANIDVNADTAKKQEETLPMAFVQQDTSIKADRITSTGNEGIFYEAGASWFYGYNTGKNRDGRSVSPVAGINYLNRLDQRFAISFGISYLRVSGISATSKTSKESSYKYGEQSKVTVITPVAAHYLTVPLRLHYSASHKNTFGASLNLSYLLNTDATVHTYDEKPGLTENHETIKLGGYTEGFSWYDTQLALFYNRRISSVLGLQCEVFMGLKDVRDDVFFGLNGKERNSGLKLTLVYYAFRKTNIK